MPESAPLEMTDLLLVTGAPRSGTSLMHHLLGSDALTLALPYEAKFISHQLMALRQSKAEFAACNHAFFDSPAAMSGHSRRYFDDIFAGLRRQHEVPILLFKDPALALALDEALELFPDARVVLMLRDPRDIVASLLEVGQRLEGRGADYAFRAENLPGVIHYALSHYAPAFELLRRPENQSRLLPVLYERFVQYPQQEIERLRQFTGLMLEGAMRRNWEVPAETPIQQAWSSDLYGQPISAERVGRYRQRLSPEALTLIETSCQGFMQVFGYA